MFSPNFLQRSWSINRRTIGFGWSTRTTVHEIPELRNLNDNCLTTIFSFIELQEIIKLRKVCSRWKRVIEEDCKRKKVLILAGIKPIGKRSLNTMILPKFEPVILAGFFPQLQSLTIHFDRKCSTDILIRFLKLQPHLQKLTLSGHAHLSTKAQLATLLQTINSCSTLKCLNLHLNNLLTESDLTTNLFFLLPQLEHLSLADCPFNLYPVLKQLKLIKSLELNSPVLTTGDVLKKAMVKNKQMQKGLTRLKLTGLKKDSDAVLLFIGKALSICELDLNEVLLSSDLIRSLKKLKTFTALYLDTIRVDRRLYHLKMSTAHQVLTLSKLTIRNLYLTDDLTADLLARTLASVFPNLCHLSISSFNVCLLWEFEKHRSAFKYIQHWELIDLSESSVSANRDNLNESEFTEPPVDHSSLMNVSIAPSEISFHSLALAIDRVSDLKPSEEKLKPIIELQDGEDVD